MNRLLQLVACMAALLCVTTGAHAETYRLSYQAEVLGVVVLGTANYEITATSTRYAARGNLRTALLARLFDQTEITAASTGSIANGAIAWTRYDLSHAYAGKFRRTQLTRAADGTVSAQISPPYRELGAPPAATAQRNGSYDPLTAMFALGRQIGVARACRGSVLVFDGRHHYRLAVAPRGQGNFSGGGYSGPALNCQFRYEPLAGFNANFDRGRVPLADAWFALPTQPGFAAPLRLTVPTPLGAAQLDLRGYQRTD